MIEVPTTREVLVDANLLALWIVGTVSPEEVPRNRRTRAYTVADFRLLQRYLSRFQDVCVTPNIATEASNLIGTLSGRYLQQARTILANGLAVWNEAYLESSLAVAAPEYIRLGLTDAAILRLADDRLFEIITDDFDLYVALSRRQVPVTNFTHLRTAGWLDQTSE